MNILSKKFDEFISKFQEGGEMAPAEAPVELEPAPQESGDPMELILAACQQVVETQDCLLAILVAQAILQMAGGGAPAQEQAPGSPVYRQGGRLVRWEKKN